MATTSSTSNIHQSAQLVQKNLAASYYKRQYHNAVKALELYDGERVEIHVGTKAAGLPTAQVRVLPAA